MTDRHDAPDPEPPVCRHCGKARDEHAIVRSGPGTNRTGDWCNLLDVGTGTQFEPAERVAAPEGQALRWERPYRSVGEEVVEVGPLRLMAWPTGWSVRPLQVVPDHHEKCATIEDGKRAAEAHAHKVLTDALAQLAQPEGGPRPGGRDMLFQCHHCDASTWTWQPTGAEVPEGWCHRGDGPPLCPACTREWDARACVECASVDEHYRCSRGTGEVTSADAAAQPSAPATPARDVTVRRHARPVCPHCGDPIGGDYDCQRYNCIRARADAAAESVCSICEEPHGPGQCTYYAEAVEGEPDAAAHPESIATTAGATPPQSTPAGEGRPELCDWCAEGDVLGCSKGRSCIGVRDAYDRGYRAGAAAEPGAPATATGKDGDRDD